METSNKAELAWLVVVMGACLWLFMETMIRLATLSDSLNLILK